KVGALRLEYEATDLIGVVEAFKLKAIGLALLRLRGSRDAEDGDERYESVADLAHVPSSDSDVRCRRVRAKCKCNGLFERLPPAIDGCERAWAPSDGSSRRLANGNVAWQRK